MCHKKKLKFLIVYILVMSVTFLYGIDEKQITDDILLKYLPEYPEAKIFKLDFLKYYNKYPEYETDATKYYGSKYIIIGDFNKNKKNEIAISGIISEKPNDGIFESFVLILEENGSKYNKIFFHKIRNENSAKLPYIKNMVLGYEKANTMIIVCFKIETDNVLRILWDTAKMKYSILEEQEE
jgi:hypothetical protein